MRQGYISTQKARNSVRESGTTNPCFTNEYDVGEWMDGKGTWFDGWLQEEWMDRGIWEGEMHGWMDEWMKVM